MRKYYKNEQQQENNNKNKLKMRRRPNGIETIDVEYERHNHELMKD